MKMNKEYLEAIEEIGNIDLGDNPYKTFERNKLKNVYNKEFSTINQALQRLQAIDNANPSEALKCLEDISNEEVLFRSILSRSTVYMGGEKIDNFSYKSTIGNKFKGAIPIIKQSLIKSQEQEKENELLKEIIKSFFVRGCPLHQYIDKDFGLTIEVDNECSIMHLGKYKGIDLNKKLQEVLKEVEEDE